MSNQMGTLYTVRKKDMPKVGAVLVDAFRNDRVWKRLFDGESRFDRKYRAFFQTPVRYCMKFGEVYGISENLEGLAAWVPGDLADMTLWRLVRSGALRYGIKMGSKPVRKMKRVLKPLPEDRKEIMKRKSYLYLVMIGVESKYQGQGFGGRLLRKLIEKSDREGMALYLETETEEYVHLYERFGFKTAKRITLPVIRLPMWEMVREPEA